MLERAFLIGADTNMSDILFWWLGNKDRFHEDIPTQIVDFGLTDQEIRDAKMLGCTIIPFEKKTDSHVWFNKPAAMLHTKAETTLWMDIDTEIMSDISDIFDMAEDGKIGLVDDQFYRDKKRPMYNSGVVLYKNRPKILYAWDSSIYTSSQRGDQEVLNELLENDPSFRESTFTLPDKYNYVRLKYQTAASLDDLRVVHWTGPRGKIIIRDQIQKSFVKKGTRELQHDFRGDENQYRPVEKE